MRRRVTFSRNLTLSLSRTCRCYCKYCSFATHGAHLYSPEEVLELLDGAARRRVKELLVLTGELPEVNPAVRERLDSYGHEDFTAYVVWTCERALERGLLPHTNLGVLAREDLARLREVTRLAGADAGVDLRAADGDRPRGLARPSIRRGGWRRSARRASCKIPFTSGILVGIGETEQERMDSLQALAEVHAEYGHLQEVILQNFVPHQRYYGQEPAEIADDAAREYWRTGVAEEPVAAAAARLGHAGERRGHEAARRSRPPADARRGGPDPARTWPTGGASWCAPAPATSAGCRPTATTSLRSTRSRRPTRCARRCRTTASR